VYCRISDDRTGLKAGVGRQEEDCRAVAARKGWGIGEVYIDNDVSAWSGRIRRATRSERLFPDP
jgi:DNA invertase Pin-like site-specific DNA recombinase